MYNKIFTLLSKNSIFENKGYCLVCILYNFSKIQILQKMECSLGILCQSTSEAIPAKIFKKNHHFNQFIFTKRKPEVRAKIGGE